jgi:hypothetical protein
MSSHKRIIRRWLAGALVVAAAATPSVAQASLADVAPSGASPSAHVGGGSSAVHAGSGFKWGDAGIGAAVTIAVLGAGASASAASRRRQTRRTFAG